MLSGTKSFNIRFGALALITATLAFSNTAVAADPAPAQASPAQATPAATPPKKAKDAAKAKDAKPAEVATTPKPEEKKNDASAVNFKANDVWDVDIFQHEDHKVLVIQDRKYTKAKRFELGVHAGLYNSSPFLRTSTLGMTATYYFTEYYGIEAFASHNWSSSTADKDQVDNFLKTHGFASTKEYREPKWFGGAAFMWAPIYGKFAFFRKAIIHFDIYGQLGISAFNDVTNIPKASGGKDQTHIGSLEGVGMRFFLSNHWSMRMDLRHNVYRTEFAPVSTTTTAGTASKLTLQNFQFTLGGSFIF